MRPDQSDRVAGLTVGKSVGSNASSWRVGVLVRVALRASLAIALVLNPAIALSYRSVTTNAYHAFSYCLRGCSHLSTLSGHRGWVEQVLFSPDGQWILPILNLRI